MDLLNSRLIIERMKSVLSVRTDDELAQILSKPSSTVRTWRNRNNLPFEIAIEFANTYSLSLDWLVSGEEKKEQLAQDEAMFLAVFRQLDQTQRAKLILQMSGLDNGSKNGDVLQNVGGNSQVGNLAGGNITIKK